MLKFSSYLASILLISVFFTACGQKQPIPTTTVQIDNNFPNAFYDDTETIEAYRAKEFQSMINPHLKTKDGGDCSGFVLLINKELGKPYFEPSDLWRYNVNGRRSRAMFNYYKSKNRIFWDKQLPEVGDLIFFHDTVGRHRQFTKSNITHIGIVYEVDSDGTVHFANTLSGINKISRINLSEKVYKKDGKIVNDYIRKCKRNESRSRCLAYGLFAGYADSDVYVDELTLKDIQDKNTILAY